MAKLLKIFGLFFLLLLIGCSGESSKNGVSIPVEITLTDRKAPVVLEKEKEFRFDLISKGGPNLVRVDDKDHLYVFVLQNMEGHCEIFKYNSADFKLKNRAVILRGQGPKEALNPRILGGDTKSIVVYDVAGNKYLRFDSKFNYIDEYKVKSIGEYGNSGGMYIPSHRLVIDMFMVMSNIAPTGQHYLFSRDFLSSLDSELFEIKAPWTKKTQGNLIFTISRPMHFTVLNEYCYILNKRDYRIVKMGIGGQIVKDIKVKFKSTALPRSLRKKWIAMTKKKARLASHMDYEEYLYPALWIIPFAEGILVGRCTDHDPDNKGPVMTDYFDKDLNYMGKFELPYFKSWNNPSSGNTAVTKNLLYSGETLYSIDFRDDDKYFITQWNVKMGENE